MKIKEIVMFPAQLQHVETISIKAEKKNDIVSNKFNISADVRGEIIDKKLGKTTIKMQVVNEDYYIEEEKIGIFVFENEIDDINSAKAFLEFQGVRILWSYVREDLYTFSSKMLQKPIMIPTIDVVETVEKAE